MSDTIQVVGDYDVSRADQILRFGGREVFTDADAAGDVRVVAQDSFGVDVDLVGIDVRFTFGLEDVTEPGASPASNLNAAVASAQISTQGARVAPDNPGVYWHDNQELHSAILVEDDTNQHGGGAAGTTVRTNRYLLDPATAVTQADLSPAAGQDLFIHARIASLPGSGNFDVAGTVEFYGRER